MKMNKKGFSLVEIIVAIAIMAVMAAVLVPSLMTSRRDTNAKMDKSAIENFEMSMVMAFQNNSIYKDAKEVADATYDKTITVVCGVDENKRFVILELKVTNKVDGLITDADTTEAGVELAELRAEVEDFINGNVEPIQIQSEFYMENLQYFVVKFPDVDFKVELASETGGEAQASDPSNRLGSPGLHGATVDDQGRWVLEKSQGVHLHTNNNGLVKNEKGDVWKIVITGEQLDKLMNDGPYDSFKFTYFDPNLGTNGKWVGGGSEELKFVNNGSSIEIYIQSQVDFPTIAVEIYNRQDGAAVIDNIQFTKVNEEP